MLKYLVFTIMLSYVHETHGRLDCPDNWITYGDSCYLFQAQPEPFQVAQQFCRQHDSHLLHVDDSNENKFVKDWLNKLKPARWWFGLTDIDTETIWRWTDTDTSVNFTDWHVGQPDNAHTEDCAVYHERFSFDWDDEHCQSPYHFVCELGGQKGETIIG